MISVPVEKQGQVICRKQVHGAPIGPAFDETGCVYFRAPDGKSLECMGQKLSLDTAKIRYNRMGIRWLQQVLGMQALQLDFFQSQ